MKPDQPRKSWASVLNPSAAQSTASFSDILKHGTPARRSLASQNNIISGSGSSAARFTSRTDSSDSETFLRQQTLTTFSSGVGTAAPAAPVLQRLSSNWVAAGQIPVNYHSAVPHLFQESSPRKHAPQQSCADKAVPNVAPQLLAPSVLVPPLVSPQPTRQAGSRRQRKDCVGKAAKRKETTRLRSELEALLDKMPSTSRRSQSQLLEDAITAVRQKNGLHNNHDSDLMDPHNPHQMRPEVLAMGLDQSESFVLFQVDLSRGWKITLWNKQLARRTIPCWLAQLWSLNLVVEELPISFVKLIEQQRELQAGRPTGEHVYTMDPGFVLNFFNLWSEKGRLVPVKVTSFEISQQSGRWVCTFAAEFCQGSIDLSSPGRPRVAPMPLSEFWVEFLPKKRPEQLWVDAEGGVDWARMDIMASTVNLHEIGHEPTSGKSLVSNLIESVSSLYSRAFGYVRGLVMVACESLVRVNQTLLFDQNSIPSVCVSVCMHLPNGYAVRKLINIKHRLSGRMEFVQKGQQVAPTVTVAMGYEMGTDTSRFPNCIFAGLVFCITCSSKEEAHALKEAFNRKGSSLGMEPRVGHFNLKSTSCLRFYYCRKADGSQSVVFDAFQSELERPRDEHQLYFESSGRNFQLSDPAWSDMVHNGAEQYMEAGGTLFSRQAERETSGAQVL